jgi:hypothetical protein
VTDPASWYSVRLESHVMKTRWLLGGGALVAIIAGYFWLHDDAPAEAMTKPSGRTGQIAKIEVKQQERAAAPTAPKIIDPLRPDQPVLHPPHEECTPDGKYCRREIVDAVPDLDGAKREELVYKIRRLRMSASDAAAPCYSGGDSDKTIHVAYSVIIKDQQLRAGFVRPTEDNLGDSTLTQCMMGAIRDMSTDAEGLPDMAQDEQLTISLHDLWTRNRSADQQARDRNTTVDPQPTPTDRPPAKIPGQ